MTVATNYGGTARVCERLFPLLRPGGRVVNVTSNCGHLSKIAGEEPGAGLLRAELSNPALTQTRLTQLLDQFVEVCLENLRSLSNPHYTELNILSPSNCSLILRALL